MRKRKKRAFRGIVFLLLLLSLVIWVAWGNTALTVTEYRIESDAIPEAFSGFRIAQISDLRPPGPIISIPLCLISFLLPVYNA